ncbi:MAG: DNA-formamidopyrimidine glycosylase family protein, partial [Gaiellales bacterium]
EAVEARGKHLLIRFDSGLAIHSHLRMSGRWDVGAPGRATRRPRATAWLILATDALEAILFNGPVLELLTPAQAGLHPALGRLGPDVLDDGFDAAAAAARARRGPAEQTVADVLLDQRVLAGVGNVWKSEALFDRRLDPWTRVADLDDAALTGLLERAAAMMRAHVASGAMRRPVRVYGRANRPCPACGACIRARAQGDEGRRTYWCPACQPSSDEPKNA